MGNEVDYEELMEVLTKALSGPTTTRWGIILTHHTVRCIKEQLQYWHDYAIDLRVRGEMDE